MGDTLAQNACNMDAMSKYHEGALRRALNLSVLALSKIQEWAKWSQYFIWYHITISSKY